MKIKFQIDKKYDKGMIISMLSGSDWEYRANKMGLDMNLAERIHKANGKLPQTTRVEINKLVDEAYDKFLPYMEISLSLYSESWNQIIKEFSNIISNKYYGWYFDNYICNITHFHSGISNWGGNIVARWWKENHFTQRRITAHEILLAHYFSIHRNKYSNEGLNDKQIWALAEIFAFAVTGLDPDIKKFWPWDNTGYYINHNYLELVKIQNKMKSPFLEMNNLNDYIEEGIRQVKISGIK